MTRPASLAVLPAERTTPMTTLGLVPIAPLGDRTPGQEALHSLLARYAGSYLVSIRYLLQDVIGVRVGIRGVFDVVCRRSLRFWSIDGTGRTAQQLADALGKLSGQRGLLRCTLVPLRQCLPKFHLLRGQMAWCPQCLRQDEPYDRLLWRFQSVKACAIHACELQSCCPACGRMIRFGARYRPGFCSFCSSSLAATPGVPADGREVWRAENMGALLVKFQDPRNTPRNRMADALAGWVAAEAGRTYKGLASAAGVGPASPANWARGDSRVSLEAAYRLAEVMGVPLSSLLTGRDAGLTPEPDRWQMMGALTAVSTREAISKRPSHRQLMDYLPARVSVLMADPDAPTYTREQVGQHLGCFYSTFQKNYPAECEILRQRRRELRALRWAGSRRSRKRLAALARSSAQPQATR